MRLSARVRRKGCSRSPRTELLLGAPNDLFRQRSLMREGRSFRFHNVSKQPWRSKNLSKSNSAICQPAHGTRKGSYNIRPESHEKSKRLSKETQLWRS